jgi:hypothetical protein
VLLAVRTMEGLDDTAGQLGYAEAHGTDRQVIAAMPSARPATRSRRR